jgi:hypothetical protein
VTGARPVDHEPVTVIVFAESLCSTAIQPLNRDKSRSTNGHGEHRKIGSVSRLSPDRGEWLRIRPGFANQVGRGRVLTEGARYGGHEAPDRRRSPRGD